MQECRDFPRLGEQLITDVKNPHPEDIDAEIELPRCRDVVARCATPPPDRVKICPSQNPENGLITTANANQFIFVKDLAEATWRRYHGLQQAHSISLSSSLPHQMASSYAKPSEKAYPRSWIDCPTPIRAAAYVAAVIRCYYKTGTHILPYTPYLP